MALHAMRGFRDDGFLGTNTICTTLYRKFEIRNKTAWPRSQFLLADSLWESYMYKSLTDT
jgi:hypothetical protein